MITDPRPVRRHVAALVKARIVLMLALTRASDAAEIQRMFAEY